MQHYCFVFPENVLKIMKITASLSLFRRHPLPMCLISKKKYLSEMENASDIFNSPPSGSELSRVHHVYDTMAESINALERRVDEGYLETKKAIGDLRAGLEERRALVVRGEIKEATSEFSVVSSEGELRWSWYTDGSAGRVQNSEITRYGVGGYFGYGSELNFSLPAPFSTSSMHNVLNNEN